MNELPLPEDTEVLACLPAAVALLSHNRPDEPLRVVDAVATAIRLAQEMNRRLYGPPPPPPQE